MTSRHRYGHGLDSRRVLERFYHRRTSRRRPLNAFANAAGRFVGWIAQYNWHLMFFGIAFAAWASTHVYYYNQLVMAEFNVKVSWAQVESLQQKRAHIQLNLSRLLQYYASYERGTINEVTETRVHKDKAPPARGKEGSLESLLGRITAVAEQYPSLQLSQTVTQISQATITTESEIALRIMTYNVEVNAYTTLLHTFPSNIFASTLGFEDVGFFTPEDPGVLEYHGLDLEQPASEQGR